MQKTLNDEIKALVCYTCAQPAMPEAYRKNGNPNDSDKKNRLRDYRAIFKNTPTGLRPEDMTKTGNGNSGTSTVDPWERERRRGQYVYNKSKQTLGTVITIAPSRLNLSESDSKAPIVAFVRHRGNINHRAHTTTVPLSIDDTTLCYEISLQELEEQHSAYNESATCKRWRREAKLPMLGTTEQHDDETEYSPGINHAPERLKKRNLAEQ